MISATVSSQGQVTIPVSIRKALDVKVGDRIVYEPNQDGSVLMKKAESIKELSDRISSYIKPGTTPVSDFSDYYAKHREVKL